MQEVDDIRKIGVGFDAAIIRGTKADLARLDDLIVSMTVGLTQERDSARARNNVLREERDKARVERDKAQAASMKYLSVAIAGWAEVDKLKPALKEALDLAELRRQERFAREGLLASEWVLRTGKAERERDEAIARAERAEAQISREQAALRSTDRLFDKMIAELAELRALVPKD